ncbi:MAG: hypothetical protein K2J78_08425 [Muribaculaceae bacterium]|nr:hypothetical protein [Muribaculaceae bacterium]
MGYIKSKDNDSRIIFILKLYLLSNINYSFNNFLKIYFMARPIKETPILYGADAKRFEERMQNPPKISSEQRAQIRKSYEAGINMLVK